LSRECSQDLPQIFNDMKNDSFIRFISTPLPMETQLAVEMRCREVMGCNDVDKVKAFCIDMMKNHARTEIVLSNAMMRMLELEAQLAVLQTPPIKNKLFYRFRLFIEKIKLARQIRQHLKDHSREA